MKISKTKRTLFMSTFERSDEKKSYKKEDLHGVLTDKDISGKDYEHTLKTWNEFEMKGMGEYHNLYLKTDVLFIADVFEEFRNMCLDYHGLYLCHYFSSPGLIWDAMFKMTDVE